MEKRYLSLLYNNNYASSLIHTLKASELSMHVRIRTTHKICVLFMEPMLYSVPTGDDETLNPDDADKILEELLEVQNNSYVFGLRLHLPQYVLDDIHKTYLEPRDRLLQVLKTFLKRVKPRPTWPIIIKALNDPAVNLPRLARIGEAAHLPCSTTTCESVFPDPVANLETSTSPTPSSGEIFETLYNYIGIEYFILHLQPLH